MVGCLFSFAQTMKDFFLLGRGELFLTFIDVASSFMSLLPSAHTQRGLCKDYTYICTLNMEGGREGGREKEREREREREKLTVQLSRSSSEKLGSAMDPISPALLITTGDLLGFKLDPRNSLEVELSLLLDAIPWRSSGEAVLETGALEHTGRSSASR